MQEGSNIKALMNIKHMHPQQHMSALHKPCESSDTLRARRKDTCTTLLTVNITNGRRSGSM